MASVPEPPEPHRESPPREPLFPERPPIEMPHEGPTIGPAPEHPEPPEFIEPPEPVDPPEVEDVDVADADEPDDDDG